MAKIVILTGDELRHDFFRKYLGTVPNIEILMSYCEQPKRNLTQKIDELEEASELRIKHLKMRNQTEVDFFGLFVEKVKDLSNPNYIPKGSINEEEHVQKIIDLKPDIIISYGCSIIKASLIKAFAKRFINIHLGLSPYYRGSGTNFFPFVNKEVQYVGVTYMYIDEGVDTGEIIHQIRPLICYGDNIHQINNRLIAQMTKVMGELILNFDSISTVKQLSIPEVCKYYNNIDFTEETVSMMYKNFSEGMVSDYLEKKELYDKLVPIIKNHVLQ